ncbi:MAG: hypothetical protein HY820_41845 [Acidobacteria bacterium]|nr:hypothetical protein [Acidobacteriota bacterium]
MFWHILQLVLQVLASGADAHRLLACGAASKGYVVGMKLPPSGLFLRAGEQWEHLGYTHPYILNLDYDRRDPRVLYLAAGNGCIRSKDGGRTWRILTSWDMTELLDVAADPHHPGTVFVGLPDGIAKTTDEGRTWQRTQQGLERKYTKVIRVDRNRPRHLLAGTESGIFFSDDNGGRWNKAAGQAAMLMHLAQSPHEAMDWMATTQEKGVLRSRDGGATWQHMAALPADSYYQVTFDEKTRGRIAVCAWNGGVRVSEDGGATFAGRNEGLPSKHVWSLRFDPDRPGRLYAGVHEEAVYVSDDAGKRWRAFGMDGSIVYNFAFVPEVTR